MLARPHRIDRPSFGALHAAIALASALGVATQASAQTGDDLPPPLPIRQVTIDPVGFPPRPYSSRAVSEVYDNLTATFGNGSSTHLGTCSQIVEDISFAGSPWHRTFGHCPTGYPIGVPRVISEITFGVGLITTNGGPEEVLIIFWDEDDLNFQGIAGAGTSMIRPNAVPLGVTRFEAQSLSAPFYWQATASLTGLPGGGVAVPDDENGIAVQVAWVTDAYTPPDTNGDTQPNWENLAGGVYQGCASTTDRTLIFGSQSGAAIGGNAASPGTTSPSYGRDISNAEMCPNIGTFIGNGNGPVGTGNDEHRFLSATPQRGYMIRLRGDVVISPPGPEVLFNSIPDAGADRTFTVPPQAVRFFALCVHAPVTDAAQTFLDITQDGSDGSIAVFDGGGAVIASDDDDGPDTQALLTFGIGRRDREGNGTPRDGRDGQLFSNGPYYRYYYLAVGTGPAGSTTFGGGFSRSSTGPGGTVNIHVRTNMSGTPLAPSVAPDTVVPPLNAGLPLAAPGARPPLGTIPARSALWYEFRVCEIANPARYLDIHTNDTPNTAIDTELFLFNDIGQLLAADDDSGTDVLSQLSFGHAGPRPAPGNGEPYAGQHGNLPAGRYFLALSLFDTTALGTRWHLRAQSNSTAVAQLSLVTDSPGFCPRCHGVCVADFDDGSGNGTPDGGVTIDDLLYYLRLFEDGPSCADVDDGTFTNTPDGGVTIDDLLYYLFRFEAGC